MTEHITFYIGIHNGKKGETPSFRHEVVEKIDMTPKVALKLLRALKEILKYLLGRMEK